MEKKKQKLDELKKIVKQKEGASSDLHNDVVVLSATIQSIREQAKEKSSPKSTLDEKKSMLAIFQVRIIIFYDDFNNDAVH